MKKRPFTPFSSRPPCLPRILAAASLILLGQTAAFAQTPLIEPNEHLSAQGVPPIAASIAERAAEYTDFRPRALLDWHPKKRMMLLSTRTKGSTAQLHLISNPKGDMQQLTDFPDPVRVARFEPKNGNYIVFEKDDGGTEANQVYRLDLGGEKPLTTQLTDPKEKHNIGPWNHRGNLIIINSTQLDKTAAGGTRAEVSSDLSVLDPEQAQSKRKVASLSGGGWGDYEWSPDDRSIVAVNRKSINDAEVWIIDVESGKMRQILPAAQEKNSLPIHYSDPHFSKDGKSLLISSDKAGEFQQLVSIRLDNLKTTIWSAHIPWDVSDIELSPNGQKVATNVNRDGLSELHLFDSRTGKELKLPALPKGAVGHAIWRQTGNELGFSLNSAQSPGELMSLNLKTGQIEQWTVPHPSRIDTEQFPAAEIVRWKSFDQRSISGLISRPPKDKFSGPRPVLISIHGGPEAQARIGFLGRSNYLLNELGVTLIQPNVRGSSGFGKTFLKLDDGMLREDSVKDIGALLDWIATQPDLDPKRVMVSGGSYGGYMSLAVSTHYADRIVGSIDTVGISNFVTFLEHTESYRRDLRRVEYGDERVPEMRAFMQKIAPLNNAQKITKPLFVIQGKNDPRVPVTEAEQMVEMVKKNNIPVWYLVADNEGHGFARKPNIDFLFFSQIKFMEEYLLK